MSDLQVSVPEDSVASAAEEVKSLSLSSTPASPIPLSPTPSASSSHQVNSVKLTKDDFTFAELLGEGAYAKVMICTRKSTGLKYAAKVLDKAHLTRNNKVHTVLVEKSVLGLMDHPNIIKLFFTFQDAYSLYLVLELAENGEMFEEIQQLGSYSLDVARFYAAELVLALQYMHSLNIVHRDLKPENLLFGEKRHLRVTDFGTARQLDAAPPGGSSARRPSFVGTASYVSPEVLQSKEAGKGSDLWALGCILYQMLVGHSPFRAGSEYLSMQKIVNREIVYPPTLDAQARDLVEKLLSVDPKDRFDDGSSDGYEQLKAHPFFSTINFDTLNDTTPPAVPRISIERKGRDSICDFAPGQSMADRSASVSSSPSASEIKRPASASTASAAPPSIWQRFVGADERILCSGLISKKKGFFSRKRQLLLTSKPRLVYIDPEKMIVKGEIPWSSGLRVEIKSDNHFYIHTPKRVYDLKAQPNSCTAQEWATQIHRSLEAGSQQ